MMPPHGSIGRSVMVCSVLPSVCWSDSGYRGGATGRNVLPIQPALYKMDRAVEHKAEQSIRSEEHTSELQSRFDLVCRLLLEKKNKYTTCDLSTTRFCVIKTHY